MMQFLILNNEFLKLNIIGYCNTDYLGYQQPNNPDFLNMFKNTFNDYDISILNEAYNIVSEILCKDILWIYRMLGQPKKFKVCVVSRSKANLQETQLYFNKAVTDSVKKIEVGISKYTMHPTDNKNTIIGTDYIKRHTNTYTTHLRNGASNYINDGQTPYPGITKDTCYISPEVEGKHILLIDDIYTKNVNIDEDAIQALLDNGAAGVTFYAVAKTINRKYYEKLQKEKKLAEEAQLEADKKEWLRQKEIEAQHERDMAEWLRQDEMGAWGRELKRD